MLRQCECKLGDTINFRYFDKVLKRKRKATGVFVRYETKELLGLTMLLARYIDDQTGEEAVINLGAL